MVIFASPADQVAGVLVYFLVLLTPAVVVLLLGAVGMGTGVVLLKGAQSARRIKLGALLLLTGALLTVIGALPWFVIFRLASP